MYFHRRVSRTNKGKSFKVILTKKREREKERD